MAYSMKDYRVFLREARWEVRLLKKVIKSLPNGEQFLEQAYQEETTKGMQKLNNYVSGIFKPKLKTHRNIN